MLYYVSGWLESFFGSSGAPKCPHFSPLSRLRYEIKIRRRKKPTAFSIRVQIQFFSLTTHAFLPVFLVIVLKFY